jgi:NAD(P)-dependent dehydrogenase (short-subunit alcohol dehydrogenase family)
VTDSGAVADFVKTAAERFGSIHGLINNAALFATLRPRPFEEFSSAEFDRVLQVNVRGTFECIKAVLPAMRRQGYGKIVNIASNTVFKGIPMWLPYVSSKGAIVALTRALARELGSDGIRVNCLSPGLTMSDGLKGNTHLPSQMFAANALTRSLSRDQMPEDLTGAAVFLLSADSDYMTGQTLVVDGGSIMH